VSAATKPAIVELLTRYFPQAVEFDDYVVETDPGYARITLSVSSTTGTKLWDFEERLRGLGLNRIHLSIAGERDLGLLDRWEGSGLGIELCFTCFRT